MDSDTQNLIVQLCTRAGMLCEDLSPRALFVKSVSPEELDEELADLANIANRIGVLMGAARSLLP